MFDLISILHYGSITFIITLSSLASGIGGGLASIAALQAINIQPRAKGEIVRASIIGLALIETAAILALIITFLVFTTKNITLPIVIGQVGIAFAVGIPALIVGIASSFPVKEACLSIARQPFFSQRILNLMLITQSIIQTAIIFGFLIGMFIKLQFSSLESLTHAFSLCASGLAIGIGSIGPALGLARFAQQACKSASVNRKAYGQLLPFVFMSEAIIETPLIFAFLISLMIAITAGGPAENMLTVVKVFAAAICIGISTLMPSLSSSKTASSTCVQITYTPQQYSVLSQTSLFGQGLIDAAAIYALLISFAILLLK
ncbi:MAG: ATP synthase F0 subunit C [Candidatus Babeliales bacterium]